METVLMQETIYSFWNLTVDAVYTTSTATAADLQTRLDNVL